jgi:5-methylthioadenosine/S-adenosylhomocysteine deaminase
VSRLLIKGGCVLTMARSNHPQADVLVEDGWITEIGTGLRDRGAEVVDASDTIVMPGFVDAHRHVWRSLFKNIAGGGAIGDLGSHFRPDDLYAATLIGLLGAAAAGTTTVVDWCEIAPTPQHMEAAIQAHADSGLRTVFALGAWSREGDWREGLRRVGGVAIGPLQITAAGPADPRGADIDRTAGDLGLARELGMRSHLHVGTDPADRGTVAVLGDRGLLGSDVTLVHCTHLDGTDLDAVAASGAPVSLTPSTDMADGVGMPPVQQLLDRGIRPGLGVDDDRHSPGDVFAQMRATISLQHAMYFDLTLAGKAGLPNLLTTREAIRLATVDGARAAGLGDRTGSLEPGKRADILVLRTDRPNIFPVNDPIGAVVWGMDTSNLDWVFVAGEAVMRHGEPADGSDRARELAEAARRRVAEAAGLMAVQDGVS